MGNKELEILKAEIEQFKAEAMKMHFVQTWAETYKTDPFEHMVDDVRGVFWLKAQAYQLWQFWNAAKATPEGFVLMPIKPTETMVMAVAKEHEGDAFLPYSLYDAFVRQAIIEAQEQSHD